MDYYSLPLPTIDEAMFYINDFSQHQQIKSLSSSTYELYTREAVAFFSIFIPEFIEHKYIHYYIVNYGNISISSKNTRNTALRVILKYLYDKGYKNCDIKVHNLKSSSKLPKSISKNDMSHLIDTFKKKRLKHSSIWRGRRDYAVLLFMYATGMRASEIVKFKLTDLDIDKGWIRVDKSKGNKDRYVPIAKVAINALNDYLKYIPYHIKYKYNEAFITDNLVPFTRLTLNYYSNKLFGYNPHIFRHTFATHLILNGCSEFVLMDILGHSSLSTTQIYTHIQKEHLRQTVIKHFPKI